MHKKVTWRNAEKKSANTNDVDKLKNRASAKQKHLETTPKERKK